MITVEEVPPHSELLEKVRRLWRIHSDTLGFFTDGAFNEHARKRCILAAVANDGSLLGYTLFRTTRRRRAAIAHLCVDSSARRAGVARQLFEAVKQRTSNCDDITVRCRRDFDANRIWPKLNFVAVGEERGRGKESTILTIWRYELNPLPMLNAMSQRTDQDPMSVAIDANVFFDIDEKLPGREESRALQADWLGQFIELCLTDEIYNEVDRRDHTNERERQRDRISRFRVLSTDRQREEEVTTKLRAQFPNWTSENDRSDIKQLAKTIASDTTYFVTRDEKIRDQADALYELFGLVVVSPFELIVEFDELRNETEYRPQRFIGLGLTKSRPGAEGDLERIVDLIHVGQAAPEPKRRTSARLRDVFANPARFEIACIKDTDNRLIASYALERPSHELLQVPLLAVSDSNLGRTAARHLAEKIVMLAASEGRHVVQVEEAAGGERIQEALIEAGFIKKNEAWMKLAIPIIASAEELAAEVTRLGTQHTIARETSSRLAEQIKLLHSGSAVQMEAWLQMERALWPAKVTGTGLACFIVPIRPHWAEQLFDTELPQRSLYGSDPMLAMSPENVYYRAARPAILKSPARVLWYVSGGEIPGTAALRACSYIDELFVGFPKEAFRRFRRLGVYTWRDVLEVAENNLDNNVMAFRFSRTELLRKPVTYKQIQDLLTQDRGKGHPLVSPVEVSESAFIALYKLATYGE